MWAANVVHVRAPIGATRGDKHRLVRRSVRGGLVVEPLGLRTQKTGWAGARCACACVCVRVRACACVCALRMPHCVVHAERDGWGMGWLGYGLWKQLRARRLKPQGKAPLRKNRKLATSLGGSKPLAVRGIVPSCLPITRGCGGARTGRVTFGRLCGGDGLGVGAQCGPLSQGSIGCDACWLWCMLAVVHLGRGVFMAVVCFYSCGAFL